MRIDLCGLSLFFLAPKTAAWTWVEGENELRTAIEKDGRALVAYVVPDERHSKWLEPEWASVEQSSRIPVLSIDCSTHFRLCQQADASSVPAIRLSYSDGTFHRYRGPRNSHSILSFVERMSRPALSHIDSSNVTSFQGMDAITLVAQFEPEDKHLRQEFERLARKYRDQYSFAVKKSQEQTESRVECYNKLDDIHHTLTEFKTIGAMENFIRLCSRPLIPELTRKNELTFYKTGKSLVHFLTSNSYDKATFISQMRPLAKKYAEYLHFLVTDAHEYPDAASMLGLQPGISGLSVQSPNTGNVYPYRGKEKLTAEVVERFLGDIIQGRVQPWQPGENAAGHDEL